MFKKKRKFFGSLASADTMLVEMGHVMGKKKKRKGKE